MSNDPAADRAPASDPPDDHARPRAGDPVGEPTADASAHLADRRAFMRQLSGEAITSAGRIAGLSSAMRRSLFAAGAAATRELEASAQDSQAAPASTEPQPSGSRADPPLASALADPVAGLTADQHAFLASGSRAVFAVNDPTGAPHVSDSMYHWDGAILRFPSQMFAARAQHVDRDPRVTVLIHDPESAAWVTITGTASLVYGDPVEAETLMVLERHLEPDAAARRWAEMRDKGDAIVIRVRPSRFLWRAG